MKKNNKKLSFQVGRRKEDDQKFVKKNIVLIHNSPVLTINVSQKGKNKNIKTKKYLMFSGTIWNFSQLFGRSEK
jgi:hypothetical protein